MRTGRRWTETCAVDGCGSPFYCKGLCRKHYKRMSVHGDPNFVYIPVRRTGCLVDGCQGKYHGRGLCASHHGRLRSGDLRADVSDRRKGRPPKGGIPGYDAAHKRVTRSLGPAANFICVDCGGAAAEWSYTGGDPDEVTTRPDLRPCEHAGLVYSLNPAYYAPRCRPCHRSKDLSLVRPRDQAGRFARTIGEPS